MSVELLKQLITLTLSPISPILHSQLSILNSPFPTLHSPFPSPFTSFLVCLVYLVSLVGLARFTLHDIRFTSFLIYLVYLVSLVGLESLVEQDSRVGRARAMQTPIVSAHQKC